MMLRPTADMVVERALGRIWFELARSPLGHASIRCVERPGLTCTLAE